MRTIPSEPHTWWARQMRSRSCLCRNFATTSAPNVNDTPRSFSPHPITSLSGSDHRRSHRRPWSGTSVGLMIRRICSMDWRSGLNPERRRHKYIYMWSFTSSYLHIALKKFEKFVSNLILWEFIERFKVGGGRQKYKLVVAKINLLCGRQAKCFLSLPAAFSGWKIDKHNLFNQFSLC